MDKVKPLPASLAQRYQGWKATAFADNHALHRRLASEGQKPQTMIISCCDSRLNVSSIFGADPGEMFIHRNIANLVPPYVQDGDKHGTSAAIEYAVTVLKVIHIIIVGHSQCGGVAGCHAMCSGQAPEMEEKSSFVGQWMEILRPGYDRVKDKGDERAQIAALEKESVLVSLENLMSFPFVQAAREAGDLTLHGLWFDIATADLETYDGPLGTFRKV